MNRAGVFFEGLSSRHLYNTKLIPETSKLSLGLKEKYHEKQKYLGEKLLRKWYLRWLEIRILSGQTFCVFIFYQFGPCVHTGSGLRVEEERREHTCSGRLQTWP